MEGGADGGGALADFINDLASHTIIHHPVVGVGGRSQAVLLKSSACVGDLGGIGVNSPTEEGLELC